MIHCFQVGGRYRNRRGEYEVISINDSNMVIRYSDGSILESPIVDQDRIWRNIQREEHEKPSPRPAGRHRQRNTPVKKVMASVGLTESDFKKGVAGTCWRRRTELAGMIAQQLSDVTSRNFRSFAIYRKAMVHIVDPVFYGDKTKWRKAKFVFELAPETAQYGFYIEKNSGAMDLTWHWPNFIASLGAASSLRDSIDSAMEKFGLKWSVYVNSDGGLIGEVWKADKGLQWFSPGESEETSLSWDGFVQRLGGIESEKWCDLYLTNCLSKDRAISLGPQIVEQAVRVYTELFPLYKACAVERET
jgi:hypothetical protein